MVKITFYVIITQKKLYLIKKHIETYFMLLYYIYIKMITQITYSCGICKTKPDQISHHKAHIETQKHKDKKELFELKLLKLNENELLNLYQTACIEDIIHETETQICNCVEKLKNDDYDKENNINTYNYSKMMTIINNSNSISNKEALRDKIHEIHNFCRNNGAGYGMNALKVFNVLYGLKKIEENNLIDKVNLKRPECEFSYLVKIANENKSERLTELIFGPVLQSISESKIRELLFYEIPQNIKSTVLVFLIKEIDKITLIEKTCNVLLSGKIYEYFIGRDESAISELGAYFTDRHIVEYILNNLNPIINEDGTVPSMIDMFGGSGGFTTGYIKYMKEKYDNINWKTELSKIHHYDMNDDVIKSAGLEFFCLTGVLPDMKNLKYKNSFVDEFNDMKFKYPLTNPPYGGDKNDKSDAHIKRDKVKEYIKKELLTIDNEGTRIRRQKQLKQIETQEKQEKKNHEKTTVSVSTCSARIQKFAHDNDLTGKDKESCSLMLLMDIVEAGGTAIGVLKEGVYFDKKYKDLRKCLVKKYNVREVISVPQDQFENTTTKTSIVIFDNTEQKTNSVKFKKLLVERYDEDKFEEILGDIVLVENKGDIKNVTDELVSEAKIDEILENKTCSLSGKDYKIHDVFCPEGYELKKLGDILKYKSKSKRKAGDATETGTYRFYTSSDTIKKCDFIDYDDDLCIIFGTGGKGSLFIDSKFSCSADNFVCYTNDDKMTKYIYYNLKNNWDTFVSRMFNGSTLGHINKEHLNNLQIPIPKDISTTEPQLTSLEKLHKQITTTMELIPQKEKEVCDLIKRLTDEGKVGEDYDEYKLGDVCEINPSNIKISTKYIEYLDIANCKEFKTERLINDSTLPSRAKRTPKINDVLLSSVRPNNKNINYITKNNYVDNLIVSTGFIILRPNIKLIKSHYIYNYINRDDITDYFVSKSIGSGYPAINVEDVKNITIKVLKPHIMEQYEIQKQFDEIDELNLTLEQNKTEHAIKNKELFKVFDQKEVKVNKINTTDKDATEENTTEESESQIKSLKKIIKDDTKNTKKKIVISKSTKKDTTDNVKSESQRKSSKKIIKDEESHNDSTESKKKVKK